MGFKEDFQREMRNVKSDVAAEVEKQWVIEFEGHTIKVINRMLEEIVLVDETVIAEKKRKSIWSHIMPYSTLVGTFESLAGKKHKVHVKLGGMMKLNCTVKVDGQKLLAESVKLEFLPWKNKQPIVSYIESQIDENGYLTNDELPDDAYLYDDHHPRLAPGLADQLVSEPVLPMYIKKLVKLFAAQVENPSDQTRRATYEKIQEEMVISYFQEFLAYYLEANVDRERAQREAIWLLEHAAHREVVKFALVILGTTDCEPHVDKLKRIALHGEFTGVALFAIMNGTHNGNEPIFEIAQRVKGWGKLETLNFLEASNEKIRKWFITEGVKNSIRTSHAALLCAEKGKLDIVLHDAQISADIFDGAGLIVSVFAERPDLTFDYEYAGQVFMRYVKHAKEHCHTLEQFSVLVAIQQYMSVDEEQWQERFATNWRPHEREAVLQGIKEISANPKWLETATKTLKEQPAHEQAQSVVKFYTVA